MDSSNPSQDIQEIPGDSFRFSPRPNRAAEIDWQAWSEEAFQRASQENKPILLAISAVWCHWCHVMDESSYSDPEIIDLVNQRFLPIRVDSDRNPDINSRYNQGGWPTTVFLAPDGVVLAGTTYIPPTTMRSVLGKIASLWEEHGATLTIQPEDILITEVTGEGPEPEIVTDIGHAVLKAWDREYGGVGDAPKFPQPETIALALELFMDGHGEEFLQFARSTIEGMILGGLMDEVEGGFFRYSTTRDWSVPHYEKMLSDNTALLSVLLNAYRTFGFDSFRQAAVDTAEYIKRTLSDGESKFYGSQDADEGYYQVEQEERARMDSPAVDETVYTDWASQAAAIFIEAGILLHRPEYIELGRKALEFLWSESRHESDGMAHYNNGAPRRFGLLDDQVAAATAFMRAYGLLGNPVYLDRAESLMRFIKEHYWDDENSELLDTARGFSLPGLRPEAADPASQARGAEAMLYFWALTGDEEWHRMASGVLTGWKAKSDSYGILAAPLARAINLYLEGPLLVKISAPSWEGARDLLRTALLSPMPRLIPRLEVERTDAEARAEICTMEACTLSTSEAKALAEGLNVRSDLLEGVERS